MATTRILIGMHDGVTTLSSNDGVEWTQGPVSPLEHAAAKVAVAPSDPQRAYLVAYEAGVHRSDDGGLTWRQLSGYPTDHAHSVTVHPSNPDRVYVGSEPATVYRTSDGGETWEECAAFRAVPGSDEWTFHWEGRHAHVRALCLSPADPDVVYAGIEVGGILRSRDGGDTWEHLQGAHPDVHKLIASPSLPSTVYAATAHGPYRSDDGGDTWLDIGEGLERRHNIPIVPSPDDHNLVVAGGREQRTPQGGAGRPLDRRRQHVGPAGGPWRRREHGGGAAVGPNGRQPRLCRDGPGRHLRQRRPRGLVARHLRQPPDGSRRRDGGGDAGVGHIAPSCSR